MDDCNGNSYSPELILKRYEIHSCDKCKNHGFIICTTCHTHMINTDTKSIFYTDTKIALTYECNNCGFKTFDK
jgi:hypothetical protein